MSDRADVVVRVAHLSKMFRIYATPSDYLREFLLRRPRHKEFWALQDVSLEIRRGEVVGIIGRNGAGKSTLLRIIAGTLDKTSGEVSTRGKVAAILELGTGFHPAYTGRENVYMGGLCLGMSRAEIDRKLDWIIRFSGLAEVMDQPLRTYSSGMQSRLAFTIAISVEPDVLIIDEALATGDAFFVGQCLERISEICKSGTTVLFVSHSTFLVQRLCDRCIHIDKGRIVDQGDALDVTSRYESLVIEERSLKLEGRSSMAGVSDPSADGEREPEDSDLVSIEDAMTDAMQAGASRGWQRAGRALSIRSISLRDREQREENVFWSHDPMYFHLSFSVKKPVSCPAIYMKILRMDGVLVHTWFSQDPVHYDLGDWDRGTHKLEIVFDELLLGDGDYALSILVYPRLSPGEPVRQAYAIAENCAHFAVRRQRPLSSIMDHPMRVFFNDKPVVPS